MPVMGPSRVSTVTGRWASAAAATSSRAAASMKEAREEGREFKSDRKQKQAVHSHAVVADTADHVAGQGIH